MLGFLLLSFVIVGCSHFPCIIHAAHEGAAGSTTPSRSADRRGSAPASVSALLPFDGDPKLLFESLDRHPQQSTNSDSRNVAAFRRRVARIAAQPQFGAGFRHVDDKAITVSHSACLLKW